MAGPSDPGGHHRAEGSNESDGDRGTSPGPGGDEHRFEVREQDRFLPIANVGRVMKRALPTNAKISKDAKETMQECVSEFISFITGEASDKCAREKRKTINGDDILWAMSTLGFDDYIEPLKLYLLKYRESESEKVNLGKQDGDKPSISGGGGGGGGSMGYSQQGMHQGLPPGMGGLQPGSYGDGMAPQMYVQQHQHQHQHQQ